MSTPAYTHDTCDPRLEEYIKFYRKSDRRASVASSSHSAKDECLPSVLVNASEPTNYNKTKDEVNASRVSGFLNEKQCCNEEWRNESAKISGFSLSHATVASKNGWKIILASKV